MRTLTDAESLVDQFTRTYARRMGVRRPPSVRFTRRLNETSGEVYPNGAFVYNRDYVELNRNKTGVLRRLACHEAAHLASGMEDHGGAQFLKSFHAHCGCGDPVAMPGETMEPPRFAYRCNKCTHVWFLMRKPRVPGYCSYCGGRLSLIPFKGNRHLAKNWETMVKRGNKWV